MLRGARFSLRFAPVRRERDLVLGLGSNLGDRRAHLDDARARIAALPGVRVVAASHLYETAPVGPPQPDYLNAALRVTCTLEPRVILTSLLAIEANDGRDRDREVRFGARTIDLDVLWIRGESVNEPDLIVPHPRLHERAFALTPLYEVAPDAVHPETGAAWAVPPADFRRTPWSPNA